MKKIALLLMLIAVFSKVLGFGREIALSYFYGTSSISDAYLISLTIPGTIFAFVAAGIATCYIPIYTELENQKGKIHADNFTKNIINLIVLLCMIIVVVVTLYTETIVKIFASGFEGETLDTAVTFTQVSVLGIFFTGIVHIFTRYLQMKRNFIIPALLGVPFNFSVVALIVISGIFNPKFLPVGTVIAMGLELLILLPFIYKNGYNHKLSISLKNEHVKKMIFLSLPVIIGSSVNQINILVDRTLASQIEIGGISALNYATRLNSFVLGIFAISIATVMYPMISQMAANNNIKGLKKTITESIIGVSLLLVPATIGMLFFSEPIVQMLFGRGAFDQNATKMTSQVLFFYSIGMVWMGFQEILSKAFYSLQDTKSPMIISMIGVCINILLNLFLSKYLGIGGLALATSISAGFIAIIMFITLRHKIGNLGMKEISVSLFKILFASLLMGIIVYYSYEFLNIIIHRNIALLTAFIFGLFSYFTIIYFMKIKDVDIIINSIKRKLGKINLGN